ncbi:MAG TPA: hypothetical protein PLA91_02900, partial [Bacillota bacterium]|nr:hypothetical protein [Bacillota bacterium]
GLPQSPSHLFPQTFYTDSVVDRVKTMSVTGLSFAFSPPVPYPLKTSSPWRNQAELMFQQKA